MLAPLGSARDKKPKTDPKDQIEVVGHIPLNGVTVSRFMATEHYSSHYLYAEHPDGKATLIDITKTNQPAVLSDVAYPPGSSSLALVAGTSVLVSNERDPEAKTNAPQNVKIMDLSDPEHPRVAREFNGVTAISRDDNRGLIFLANAEGVWILRKHLAEDPEVQRAYEDYVIYGSSMYPPHK